MSTRSTGAKQNKGWVLPYMKQQAWRFFVAACFGTLAVACAGGLMFTSGYLISRSSMQPENVLMVYVPIVLVRTFGFAKAAIQYAERLISHDTVLRLLSRMRVRLYRILEPQAIFLRSRFRSGDLIGLLAEDIEQLQHVFLRLVLPSISALLIYAGGAAALGFFDLQFALFMALYCGFFFFTIPFYTLLRSQKYRKQYIEERSMAYQELTDAVFGMSDWLLSGRSSRVLESFNNRQLAMGKVEKKMRRAEWRTSLLSQTVVGGAVLFMLLWAANYSAEGLMKPEWIAAFALVTFPLLDVLVKAGEALIHAPEYKQSIYRLKQTEQNVMPSELPKIRQEESNGTASEQVQRSPTFQSAHIELKNVSYRYIKTEKRSVNRVSLQLPQGSKTAIIGKSGSGKSTLLKLIQGEILPEEGSIMINGGSSAQMKDQQSRLFAVLNQQPYLFDTTIANNIRIGRPTATNDEVRTAIHRAGLGSLIAALPNGLQTRVQEAGVRFSGGERQRIALARILLMDCPVVLLDEPAVGLDPITEKGLISTIFQTLQGKTLIWITHHLTGMEHMDQILFMEEGKIVMHGTHQELLTHYDRYGRLYALDQPWID